MSECLHSKHTLFVRKEEESIVGQLNCVDFVMEGVLAYPSKLDRVAQLVADHPRGNSPIYLAVT